MPPLKDRPRRPPPGAQPARAAAGPSWDPFLVCTFVLALVLAAGLAAPYIWRALQKCGLGPPLRRLGRGLSRVWGSITGVCSRASSAATSLRDTFAYGPMPALEPAAEPEPAPAPQGKERKAGGGASSDAVAQGQSSSGSSSKRGGGSGRKPAAAAALPASTAQGPTLPPPPPPVVLPPYWMVFDPDSESVQPAYLVGRSLAPLPPQAEVRAALLGRGAEVPPLEAAPPSSTAAGRNDRVPVRALPPLSSHAPSLALHKAATIALPASPSIGGGRAEDAASPAPQKEALRETQPVHAADAAAASGSASTPTVRRRRKPQA